MEPKYRKHGSKAILATEAGSIATRSAEFAVAEGRSLIITVVLGTKVGAATVTPSLQRKLADGTFVTYWTAAAALSAAGTVTYIITPDPAPTYTVTESKLGPVPLNNKLLLTFGGTTGAGNSYDTYAEVEVV